MGKNKDYINNDLLKRLIFIHAYVCACMYVQSCAWVWRRKQEEGVRSPTTRVTGNCESPDIAARH